MRGYFSMSATEKAETTVVSASGLAEFGPCFEESARFLSGLNGDLAVLLGGLVDGIDDALDAEGLLGLYEDG